MIPIKPASALGKRLVAAGYQVIREVSTRKVFGSWSTDQNGNPLEPLRGPATIGRWYEVITPHGQSALFMKQGNNCFHVFGAACWTASDSCIERAHLGGLGDAISTEAQMRTYARLVLSAPGRLVQEYDGLSAAQGQV